MRFVPTALSPEPRPAHDWLARELSRPEYQPSLFDRFTRWLHDVLNAVLDVTVRGGGPGPVVSVVLLVALVALVVVVLTRLQATTAAPAGGAEVFADGRLSAERHRELARDAYAAGRWDEVVVESVRALAAGLLERGLVADQQGATAHEIADRSRYLFPDEQDRLQSAAVLFDETMYGDRPTDEPHAREVMALEQTLRTAGPVGVPGPAPRLSVPR